MQDQALMNTLEMVKRSLHMAGPMIASRVLVAVSNFYAMWLLARLSQTALAAGALIFVLQTVVTVVLASVLFALGPIVGRAFGAQDYAKIGAVAQQGWFLSLFLTIPSFLIFWFAEPILLAARQAPAVAAIAGEYFHIYAWIAIPMFFFSTNQILLMGVGKQRLAFLSSLIATIALFVFTPLFTFGLGIIPALGVKGIAMGMNCSLWAGFLFSSLYSLRLPFFAPFELFRWRLQESWVYLKQILVIGWPIVVQIGGELGSWFAFTLLIGWLGETALSAQQIVNQFNILVIIPVVGLSQAAGILVGQAAGAKRYHEVQRLGYINMGIGVVIMLVVMVIYLAIPKVLIGAYLQAGNPDNDQIIHLARLLFAVSAFSLLFDNVRNIAMGALRGVYDSRYPMYLGLVIMWLVGLPLGYVFAFYLHGGVVGFALAGLIGVSLAAILLVYRWQTRIHHLMAKADASDLKHASL